MTFEKSEIYAGRMDEQDSIASYREKFYIPKKESGEDILYFCGNSLGLQPRTLPGMVEQELKDWQQLAVDGHFAGKNPWIRYHEPLGEPMAAVVGALEKEVTVMNTLSVNLHLMMVSFYRPTKQRHKILMEFSPFPSDQYAVQSQVKFHGFDPSESIIELEPAALQIKTGRKQSPVEKADEHKTDCQ